jgi:periplasmic copper chaperone A
MDRSFLSYVGGFAIVAVFLILFALPPAKADQPYKSGSIVIDQPWARATPAGAKTAAVYFIVRNTGTTEDRLIGAHSSASGQVDIHQMTMDNNVMKMAPVTGGIAIPASGSVTLGPSGFHIMLIDLKQPLVKGNRLPLTLTFEHAGSIDIQGDIEAIGSPGPATQDKPAGAMDNMKMDGMKM